MALVRLNPSVPAISGRVGSVVFVKGKTTTTIRSAPPSVHRDTSPVLSRIAQAQTLASAWTAFPDDVHSAWRDYANRQLKTNRVDLQHRISGFHAYMQQGLSFTTLPTLSSFRPPSTSIPTPNPILTVTYSISSGLQLAGMQLFGPPVPFYQVWGSRTFSTLPTTKPRRFIRLPDRQVAVPTQDYTAVWEQRLGPPILNEYIWLRIRIHGFTTPPSGTRTYQVQITA